MDTSEMPDAFFEDQGVKFDDAPFSLFTDEGEPFLLLFMRQTRWRTVPMAAAAMGKVYFVEFSEITGLFRREVRLELRDSNWVRTTLSVPLNREHPSVKNKTPEFVELAGKILKLMPVTTLPAHMFARNLSFKQP